MNRLSKEEVLHVANLARLELTEEEIDTYAIKLKEILDEVDKIKDIEVLSDEVMISPNDNVCVLSDDEEKEMLNKEEILKNAPKKYADYIEVRGVFE